MCCEETTYWCGAQREGEGLRAFAPSLSNGRLGEMRDVKTCPIALTVTFAYRKLLLLMHGLAETHEHSQERIRVKRLG